MILFIFRYLIGVYDQELHNLKLVETPLLIFNQRVKKLHGPSTQVTATKAASFQAMQEAKSLLGQTFGNKKIQQRIRAGERSALEMANLGQDGDHFESPLTKRAELAMPVNSTNMDERVAASIDRLLPPHNTVTTDVSKIYKIEDCMKKTTIVHRHFLDEILFLFFFSIHFNMNLSLFIFFNYLVITPEEKMHLSIEEFIWITTLPEIDHLARKNRYAL